MNKMNEEAQKQFKAIIEQMALDYKHDSRPWMIGYSGVRIRHSFVN